MAFKKHIPTKIEIDESALSFDSPEVARRMERIETNFLKFDELMTDLEFKLPDEPKANEPKSKAPKKPR
jgi:hypothetical protein